MADKIIQMPRGDGFMPLNAFTIPAPETIRPRPWLLGYWLMRGAVTLIAAPGGTGKTALLTTAILSCASDRQLLHAKPHRRLRVAFLGLEESEDEMKRRFAAAMKHHGLTNDDIEHHIYYLDGRKHGFTAAWINHDGSVQQSPQIAELITELQMMEVDVLFADPLALAHSAPENDNGAMAQVIGIFNGVAQACDIGICLIHHTRKGAVAGDPDSIRGAGALINHARIALGLSPISEDDAKVFNLTKDDARRLVRIDDLKLNYSPKAGDARWLRLESVSLGNATPDYPAGDSVQVATVWEPPAAMADLTIDVANQILDEIEKGSDGERYSIQRNAAKPAHKLISEIMNMHGAEKSDRWCRNLISLWLKAVPPVVREQEYHSENQRKTRKGLFVNSANRPGSVRE